MRKYGESDETVAKAEGLLHVLHCYTMEKQLRDMEFPDMALKVILGFPRYVTVIPAEKAYYDAGMAAKAGKKDAVAFQYLSRFLDIREKIEEGERDSSSMDNTDFATTDFPFNFPLAGTMAVSDDKFEEANDWILAQAIENTGDSGLPTVDCPQTGVKMFEGALRSPAGPLYDACCITGYPILGGAKTDCKNCNRPSNQEDWNRFVLAYKKCPWCHTDQNADFTVAGGL
jgi:intraflagellar transport protein 172